jgi:hypothetical protein
MDVARRDFMKKFGITVASLVVTSLGCGGCYAPPLQTPGPTQIFAGIATPITPSDLMGTLSAMESTRIRLRYCWQSFDLVARIYWGYPEQDDDFLAQWFDRHRAALDELVGAGEISKPAAELVQESYEAGLNYVINPAAGVGNNEMTNYGGKSAESLLQQSKALDEIADQGNVDPETIAKVRTSLEHEMAYYALSDQEAQALRERIETEWKNQGKPIPLFENLDLEVSPDVKEAAEFIIELLTTK